MVQVRIHVVNSDSVDAYTNISYSKNFRKKIEIGNNQAVASQWRLRMVSVNNSMDNWIDKLLLPLKQAFPSVKVSLPLLKSYPASPLG